MDNIEQAIATYAKTAHKGQKYKGDTDYFDDHIITVVANYKKYYNDILGICAAYLHDVVEDCIPKEQFFTDLINIVGDNPFAKELYGIVLALTKLDSTGATNTNVVSGGLTAIKVKLADIETNTANMETYKGNKAVYLQKKINQVIFITKNLQNKQVEDIKRKLNIND